MIELHDNEKYDHFVAMNLDIKVVILLIFIILLFIIVGSKLQLFFQRVWQVWVNTKKNDNEKQKRVLNSFLEGSHFHKYYKRKRTKKKNRYHDTYQRDEINKSTALSSSCWNDFKKYIVLRLIPHLLKNVWYWFQSKTHSNIVDSNDGSNNEERIYIGLDCEMVGADRKSVV